jgi:Zn-finger nucleic acid-binding protein
MKCPACGGSLVEVTLGGVKVNQCVDVKSCGGWWFHRMELQNLDDVTGTTLVTALHAVEAPVRPGGARACPGCGHPAMTQRRYGRRFQVLVHNCSRCEGIWLDGGELAAIRAEFESRKAAAQAAIDKLDAGWEPQFLEVDDALHARTTVKESFMIFLLREVIGLMPRP